MLELLLAERGVKEFGEFFIVPASKLNILDSTAITAMIHVFPFLLENTF